MCAVLFFWFSTIDCIIKKLFWFYTHTYKIHWFGFREKRKERSERIRQNLNALSVCVLWFIMRASSFFMCFKSWTYGFSLSLSFTLSIEKLIYGPNITCSFSFTLYMYVKGNHCPVMYKRKSRLFPLWPATHYQDFLALSRYLYVFGLSSRPIKKPKVNIK